MEDFFKKHPMSFTDMTAVKMIHKKIEDAQHKLKSDKKSTEYIKDLCVAYQMLCDYFTEKGINPDAY